MNTHRAHRAPSKTQQEIKFAHDNKVANREYNMSYEEIAKELNITVSEVQIAEKSAMKVFKHPVNGNLLKDYLSM